MKLLSAWLFLGLLIAVRVEAQTAATTNVETIVCIRHGEKPPGGLGQLTIQGLNRALALPKVLIGKFGQPQYIFAPDPTKKIDKKKEYYYVRPLVTIEPTAIRCGLPIDLEFSFPDIDGLEKELEKPKYQNATIFMAWEHSVLDEFAKNLIKHEGGDPTQVPAWSGSDFDTIFVFKITQDGKGKSISFTVDHEGLNNLKDTAP